MRKIESTNRNSRVKYFKHSFHVPSRWKISLITLPGISEAKMIPSTMIVTVHLSRYHHKSNPGVSGTKLPNMQFRYCRAVCRVGARNNTHPIFTTKSV